MEKILIPEKVAPETIRFLQEKGYEVILGTGLDEETLNQQLDGCAAIMVRVAKVTRKIMQDQQALEEGIIAGAGLDVTDPEPLPQDHALFRFDDVIVTPHSAASTLDSMVRMGIDAAEGIDDVLNGRTPHYRVV